MIRPTITTRIEGLLMLVVIFFGTLLVVFAIHTFVFDWIERWIATLFKVDFNDLIVHAVLILVDVSVFIRIYVSTGGVPQALHKLAKGVPMEATLNLDANSQITTEQDAANALLALGYKVTERNGKFDVWLYLGKRHALSAEKLIEFANEQRHRL